MVTCKKVRRNSGRRYAKYHENLPFSLRDKHSILDENLYWDDWNDYRDGMRNIYFPFKNKGKYRKKYFYKFTRFSYIDSKIIFKRLSRKIFSGFVFQKRNGEDNASNRENSSASSRSLAITGCGLIFFCR